MDMPSPVPEGQWAAYAAAISEGFCPSCRQPAGTWSALVSGVTVIWCRDCACCWELNLLAYVPVIRWRGPDGTDGSVWDIYAFRDDDRYGGKFSAAVPPARRGW